MIKKIFFQMICCFFLPMILIHTPSFAKAKPRSGATLMLPAETLSGLISDALPIPIDTDERISGRIWIKDVKNLKLGKNSASAKIRLTGKKVKYNEKIGGFSTSLNFGNVDVSFDCRATIRYNGKKGLLYIKPTILPGNNKKDMITPILMALFNEMEYPIQIKKPEPITTQLGKNALMIHLNISNISTRKNRLLIEVSPDLKKTAP
jgi:hypothetical protein